jgi:hypothetical protein
LGTRLKFNSKDFTPALPLTKKSSSTLNIGDEVMCIEYDYYFNPRTGFKIGNTYKVVKTHTMEDGYKIIWITSNNRDWFLGGEHLSNFTINKIEPKPKKAKKTKINEDIQEAKGYQEANEANEAKGYQEANEDKGYQEANEATSIKNNTVQETIIPKKLLRLPPLKIEFWRADYNARSKYITGGKVYMVINGQFYDDRQDPRYIIANAHSLTRALHLSLKDITTLKNGDKVVCINNNYAKHSAFDIGKVYKITGVSGDFSTIYLDSNYNTNWAIPEKGFIDFTLLHMEPEDYEV